MKESPLIQRRSEHLEPHVLEEPAEWRNALLTEAACPLSGDELRRDHVMPLRVTQFYYDQIRHGQHFEQLRRIVQPSIEELGSPGRWDTSGEQEHTVVTGLQHKYPQTALLLVTADCFSHCRFCFRRRLLETNAKEIAPDFSEAAAYIRQHPEIDNVLLSGGDPFTLSTGRLRGILDHLLPIPHLSSIRFGTKAMVFYPARFRDRQLRRLLAGIQKARKTPVIVTHIDHVGEISEETEVRIRELRAVGVQFFNQTVLLRKVNDDPNVLAATFRELHGLGVRPYYLFQARPAMRASHFQVPFHRGLEIVREVNRRLNGIEKTFRYVMSHETGKLEILDLDRDNRLWMRYHQCADVRKTGTVFWRIIGEDACWLDDAGPDAAAGARASRPLFRGRAGRPRSRKSVVYSLATT